MTIITKYYENKVLGISFDYPEEWEIVEDPKIRDGVDVLICHNTCYFGIKKVAQGLTNEILEHSCNFVDLARSKMLMNKTALENIEINKYNIDNKNSTTLKVCFYDTHHNRDNIQDRIYVLDKKKGTCLLIALSDSFENYASGKSQKQLNHILNSFRFL